MPSRSGRTSSASGCAGSPQARRGSAPHSPPHLVLPAVSDLRGRGAPFFRDAIGHSPDVEVPVGARDEDRSADEVSEEREEPVVHRVAPIYGGNVLEDRG